MRAKRLVTAAVLLPPLYFYVMKLPPVWFFGLLTATALAAQFEFYRMYKISPPLSFFGLALGVLVMAAVFGAEEGVGMDVLTAAFIALAFARLFLIKDPSAALGHLSPALMGIMYVPLLMSYQLGLRAVGPEWIIYLYGTIWCSDSFAYYIGKSVGKRRLYASVSPNKTVAGGVGSLAGGAAGSLLLNILLTGTMNHASAAALGIAVGALAVCGDLLESMFKRDAGVKDSSNLIPGHGGLLDKLDGSITTGPILLMLIKLFDLHI